MPRSSRTTVTGPDRPGRLREPSWPGNGRRTTTTVPTKATTRTTTTRVATPRRLSRSTRRRGTLGTLTPRHWMFREQAFREQAFEGRRGGWAYERRRLGRGSPARLGRPARGRGRGPAQCPQQFP